MSEAQDGGNVMERLTYWNEEYGCWSYHCGSGEAANRLAAYEETGLSPQACAEAREAGKVLSSCDISFRRLAELLTADKDGRLVALPCKVGDTVYRIVRDADPHITRDEVRNIYFADDMTLCVELVGGRIILSEKFGKTVFLTREEAEAAAGAAEGSAR